MLFVPQIPKELFLAVPALPYQPTHVEVSISGGKDSTVMAMFTIALFRDLGIEIRAHHQRILEDWEGTVEHCYEVCDALGLSLTVEQANYTGYQCRYCPKAWLSTKPKTKCPGCKVADAGEVVAQVVCLSDLIRWRKRWPDQNNNRYCTAYLKREVFDKYGRRNRADWGDYPIVTMGERRLEGVGRSKLAWLEPRKGVIQTDNFHPILHLRRREVFCLIRDNGLPLHPCYRLQGMTDYDMYESEQEQGGGRMSCMCCIFMQPDQLQHNLTLAIPHNQDLARALVGIEAETGHTWREGLGVSQILAGQTTPTPKINRGQLSLF